LKPHPRREWGQIPIERGTTDATALERAIGGVALGARCLGIFLRGHSQPRPRFCGPKRPRAVLAEAVPEARIFVAVRWLEPTDIARFPKRPTVFVCAFFSHPAGGWARGTRPSARAILHRQADVRGSARTRRSLRPDDRPGASPLIARRSEMCNGSRREGGGVFRPYRALVRIRSAPSSPVVPTAHELDYCACVSEGSFRSPGQLKTRLGLSMHLRLKDLIVGLTPCLGGVHRRVWRSRSRSSADPPWGGDP